MMAGKNVVIDPFPELFALFEPLPPPPAEGIMLRSGGNGGMRPPPPPPFWIDPLRLLPVLDCFKREREENKN